MKKFRYSLANVLRLRQTMKRIEEMAAVEARAELAAEERRAEAIAADLAGAVARDRDCAHAGLLRQHDHYLAWLRHRRDDQDRRVAEARDHLAARQQQLNEANTELRKVEVHRDHEAERWQYECNRAEQQTLDEVAARRRQQVEDQP